MRFHYIAVAGVVACSPAYYPDQPHRATQPESPATALHAESRGAAEIVSEQLASDGVACTRDGGRWLCSVEGSKWPFYVEATEDNTTIRLSSYAERATAQNCSQFVDAIRDLSDPDQGFTASCDDTVNQFRFDTSFAYGRDAAELVISHGHHRRVARDSLTSLAALAAN